MITKLGLKKFIVTTISFIIIAIYSILPNNMEHDFNTEIKKEYNDTVYLLDKDNYVSRLDVFIDKNSIETIIKEKLDLLIKGKDNFKSLIPIDTKILNISVKEDKVTLNFSKEILSIKKELTRSMIEGIIYSLTEINGINDIFINVDGVELKEINGIKLSYPLNRSFGINIEYDLFNLNNINKTTVFFVKKEEDTSYYVPITKVSNDESDKIYIILEELKSSVNSQDNLKSYISNDLLISSYEKTEDAMNLIFNDYIFESINSNNILEEVKYTISLSVIENYGVNEVIFNTSNNEKIEVFKNK